MNLRLKSKFTKFSVVFGLLITGCAPSPVQNQDVSSIPERVLTFGPNCTELFCALGLQDRVIGSTLNNHSRGPLERYKEEYASIPQLTYGSATREAVMGSGADFIYGIDWEFGEEGIRLDELEQFGIKAMINDAQTIEEELEEIEELGKRFQIEEQADALIQDQKDRIQKIEDQVKNKEPMNVLVYDSEAGGVKSASGSNFESRLIEKAGGRNIFHDLQDRAWITISPEEILHRDVDVIVIHDYDVPSLEEKIETIKSDPALSQLEAVQQNRFVPVSLENVLPGSRMADTIELFYQGFQNGGLQ